MKFRDPGCHSVMLDPPMAHGTRPILHSGLYAFSSSSREAKYMPGPTPQVFLHTSCLRANQTGWHGLSWSWELYRPRRQETPVLTA